jgi:hypothetical protein
MMTAFSNQYQQQSPMSAKNKSINLSINDTVNVRKECKLVAIALLSYIAKAGL